MESGKLSVNEGCSGGASDVVVIGAGLGGLSAAIHLRLAGFEVTVLEKEARVGGRANLISEEGFRFDTGPSLLNYPWVFEDLFKAAGRKLGDYLDLLKVDPSVSFQWEDGRQLQLSSDVSFLGREFERLEPGSRASLMSFFSDAAVKYRLSFEKLINRNEDNPLKWIGNLKLSEIPRLGVWRSLDQELRRFFKSRYIREALGAYGMYLGGSPFSLPGLFSILAYGELAYGLWLPKGGIYAVVEAIEKLALELGVEIRTSSPVSRISVEDREVRGVLLSDGKVIRTRVVVSNVDVPTTNEELVPPSFSRKSTDSGRSKMTPGVLTFYWGVKGHPKGLGHHTIFLPNAYREAFEDLFENGRIPEHLPFYVSVPSATDSDLAPEGHSAVFVLVPTPVLSRLGDLDWDKTVAEIKSRVFGRLKQHGIDLSAESIVFERVFTPVDWKRKFGLYDGSAFGLGHGLFQVGPFRPRNYSSEISGLFYTGASTTPGTGMPMVLLSGKLAADRVRERLARQGSYRPELKAIPVS